MATINDVCKLVGVSKATVSRAINAKGQVKESTRKAVFAAMQELGFKPNRLAQALATNSSNSIGLVVSNFDGNYFGALLKQAAKAVEDAGKQLIVTDGHDDPQREIAAIDSLVDRRCDAIVLYSRSLSEQDFTDLKQRISVPIVVINRQLKEKAAHAVSFDQYHAAQLAVNHLLDLNHQQIACITSPLNSATGQMRLKGYLNALAERGIVVNQQIIIEGSNRINSGYLACKNILATGEAFSALFAGNDNMAIGAIKALFEAGLKVPDDVSVIAIDNETVSAFLSPSLSTVELPIVNITDTAMQIALDLAKGKAVEAGCKLFQGKLIVRDSTARPR